jgi:electron transport complex protein RnfD
MQQLQFIFGNVLPQDVQLDAITSATPLDYLKTQLKLKQDIDSIKGAPIFGILGGKGAEYITIAYLLGGLYLLREKIITWQLPTAFLGTLVVISGIFWLIDPAHYVNPLFHLFSGASLLAAFFIITDPVSGPTTPKGKLYFAAGIAIMAYLIRNYGGYPDGIAFAVIFMNICVPLIDAWTQPRVFGHEK